jgi:polyisoprenoid-binding protein YceI
MFPRRLSALALAAALSLGATASFAQSGLITDPAKVQGGAYALDKSHAKIVWTVSHFGFSSYYGEFTDFDAKLAFEPKTPEKSRLEVTINTAGLATHDPKLDQHLKSADFFNVEKFPTATFKSSKVEATGPATGRVTGDLTLLGVTKPVVLDVTFNGAGVGPVSKKYTSGFSAEGTIKRTDFGMSTFAPFVGDEVKLLISGEFIKPE